MDSKYEGHTPGTHRVGLFKPGIGEWPIFQQENNILIGTVKRLEDAMLYADAPLLAEQVEKLAQRVSELELAFDALYQLKANLAEQNAKMLEALEEFCHECSEGSDGVCSGWADGNFKACKTGALIAEIER